MIKVSQQERNDDLRKRKAKETEVKIEFFFS